MMIRSAIIDDESAVRACAHLAYVPYISLIGRKPAPMLADYVTQIAKGWVHITVDASNQLQGFIVFHPLANQMLLEKVAVVPSAARQNIGKSLIVYCEQAAMKQGLHAVQRHTNAKMSANLGLYPKLGYPKIDGTSSPEGAMDLVVLAL